LRSGLRGQVLHSSILSRGHQFPGVRGQVWRSGSWRSGSGLGVRGHGVRGQVLHSSILSLAFVAFGVRRSGSGLGVRGQVLHSSILSLAFGVMAFGVRRSGSGLAFKHSVPAGTDPGAGRGRARSVRAPPANGAGRQAVSGREPRGAFVWRAGSSRPRNRSVASMRRLWAIYTVDFASTGPIFLPESDMMPVAIGGPGPAIPPALSHRRPDGSGWRPPPSGEILSGPGARQV
jgi:hypothetical protein